MENTINFLLSDTAANILDIGVLTESIENSTIESELQNIVQVIDGFVIVFSMPLSPTDLTTLNSLVASHFPATLVVSKSVKQNKEFADDMMQRLKEKNILEGLDSIDKSAWVHHRMRKVDYTLSDTTTVAQLDVMNLVVTGDIETAEQALGQMSPDDMTKDYHWLTQERIDWIRNEIRNYLGWPLI